MHCPNCGTPMNRHAEKLVSDPQAPEGEVLASFHCCANCGKVEAQYEPSAGS